MSDVASIPALASLYTPPATPSTMGTTDLGEDAFLRLLTTQLQYQDPSDPVKNEAFVAQLAQFSSLEQLEGLNGTLDGVYAALAAMNNASMASLLGTDVIAAGNAFTYGGEGPVTLQASSPVALSSATLTVYDEDGGVVWSGDAGALPAGAGSVTWGGLDASGQSVPAGTYTFSIAGFDAAGNAVDVDERITGTITEMDYSTGTPLPSIDGNVVQISDILTLTSGDAP